jgi:hypothetical protein
MKLKVKDHQGKSLSGVKVWYDLCGPWVVFDGELSVAIPQLDGGKLVLQDGHSGSEYSVCIGSDELADKTITLPVRQAYDVEFHLVEVQRSPLKISSIETTNTVNITAIFNRSGNACMNMTQTIATNYDIGGSMKKSRPADLYPTETYAAEVITGSGKAAVQGFTVAPGTGTIHVYAPSMEGFTESDLGLIEGLYDSCGISAVSAELYGSEKVGCG